MHLAITIGLGVLALIFIVLFTRENRYSKRLEGIVSDRNVDIKILDGSRDRALSDFGNLSRSMEGKFRVLGFTGKDDPMITDAPTAEKITAVVSENRGDFDQREAERKEKKRQEDEAARAALIERQKNAQQSNSFEAATGSVGFAAVATTDFGSSFSCDAGGADCG